MPLEARGQFLEFILSFAGIELSSSGLVASASVMPALAYFCLFVFIIIKIKQIGYD